MAPTERDTAKDGKETCALPNEKKTTSEKNATGSLSYWGGSGVKGGPPSKKAAPGAIAVAAPGAIGVAGGLPVFQQGTVAQEEFLAKNSMIMDQTVSPALANAKHQDDEDSLQEINVDTMAVERVPPLPAPVATLQRGQRERAVAEPGAFRAGFGQDLQRNAELPRDLVTGGEDSEYIPPPLMVRGRTNDGLAEATPVQEQEGPHNLSHALEVNPEALRAQSVQREKERNRKLLGYGVAGFCLLFILVAVLTLVLPDSAETTAAPSETPSSVPSSAPTGALDLLLEDLPEYTQASLLDASSAQSRAWEWVRRHPNVTHMPEWKKKQVFVLVTFFYAMRGDQWRYDFLTSWLNEEVDECHWYSAQHSFYTRISPDPTVPIEEQVFGFKEREDEAIERYGGRACNEQGEFRIMNLYGIGVPDDLDPPSYIPPEITLLPELHKVRFSTGSVYANFSEFLPTEIFEMARLTELDFSNAAIVGTIPTELGLLTNLRKLELARNGFHGTMPSELGLLTKLTHNFLSLNQLTGTIPTEVGLMKDVGHLWISFQAPPGFSGQIPSEVGLMAAMTSLDVEGSSLTGTIPTEVALATKLELVKLRGNPLTGTIPSELGLLESLKEVRLSDTAMSGTLPQSWWSKPNMTRMLFYRNELMEPFSLPTDIGTMTAMYELVVFAQQVTGTIPSQVGLLSKISVLHHGDNSLTGTMPTELGLLTELNSLYLRNNELSGAIPSELGSMNKITLLQLRENSLSGSIPRELGRANTTQTLELQGNRISGFVPSELGLIDGMRELRLQDNMISGTIPVEFALMMNLVELDLHNNALSGTIPSELSLVTTAQTIDLSGNRVSGFVPSEVGLIDGMRHLRLQDNMISGVVPIEFAMMTNLVELNLHDNLFSGTIPSELGLANTTQTFDLSSNRVSGFVPSELGLIGAMLQLRLQDNLISGTIPIELAMMTNLAELDLHDNALSGTIPEDLALLTTLRVLDLSNLTFLSGSIPFPNGTLFEQAHYSFAGSNQLSGTIAEEFCQWRNANCTLSEERACAMEFDCSERLCGCDCPCLGEEATHNTIGGNGTV